jgi:heavy metal translocating P-type ATPase
VPAKTFTRTLPFSGRLLDHIRPGVAESAAAGRTHESSARKLRITRVEQSRIAIVALAALLVWLHMWEPLPKFSVIGICAVLFGAYPIFSKAFHHVLARRMTMELSMAIALAAALSIREFFTALIITLFVLVAEVLEDLTVSRGRTALRELLALMPQTAWSVKGGVFSEVAIADLRPGDRVLIRPGASIPVDGIVATGNSAVDEATLTGEPMPHEKAPGSRVFAGTLNQTGALEVIVDRLGRDTAFGRILQSVEAAGHSKAPVQRMADRLSGYIVYCALASACLTLMIRHDVRATISVIIAAGACGIAAGTPLAILGAISRAARQGAIIKGGIHLEQLAKTDTILLDKTGTVTYGSPRVIAVEPVYGISELELLQMAAIAERKSEHPFAQAVLAAAAAQNVDIPDSSSFQYTPGKGVRAKWNGRTILAGNTAWLNGGGVAIPMVTDCPGTHILIARDSKFIGTIYLADEVRRECSDAIRSMHEMGLRVELLTGDTAKCAREVASGIGVNHVSAGLLPEQKAWHVQSLKAQGHVVTMIGDGVNDAPALAHADIGVAMGSATDIAQASAAVLLIGNDLRKFVETLETARKCRRIIMQNFYGTLIVDSLGMTLAAVGLLNPLLATFVHVSSELLFILNSTRLISSKV